ncbi:MAG: hypothetical protein U9Q99_01590 [Nanoarchaeota archaeon]|nr:hypothetical protein [Nanoarchaeota archaeon]
MSDITSRLKKEGWIVTLGEVSLYGGGFKIIPNISGGSERKEYQNEILDKFYEEFNNIPNEEILIDIRKRGISNYSGVVVYLDASSGKPLEIIDPNYQEVIWKSK